MEKTNIDLKYPQCTKVNGIRPLIDAHSAVVYSKLRYDGCPRRKARDFATHTVCKFDLTKTYDGPVQHRTLKVAETLSIRSIKVIENK